jgi:hypothetical protein
MKHVQIAHQMPGRVRFKVPRARDNPELLEQIRQVFAGMPGLKQTRVKPSAGSIVLLYDPNDAAAFEARMMQQWREMTLLMPRRPPRKPKLPGDEFERVTRKIEAEAEFLAGHSHSARAIVDFFKEADQQIKILTNNVVDFKIVLALVLAVATFAGVGASAATPMWVTLALFALNHLIELQTPSNAAPEPRRTASLIAA